MIRVLGAFVAVFLAFGVPVLAALEWTTTVLYFNVAANDEVTVTLYGAAGQTSSDTGAATPLDIEFNSSTGTDYWLNATVTSTGGNVQDDTNPIFQIDNTGNTDATTINITITGNALNACQKLAYNLTYQSDPGAGGVLVNSSYNTTINTSYTPAETAIDLWLWGNFTECAAADDSSPTFRIYADFP